MIEVKTQSDVELYSYYVVRDNTLFKTKNLNDVNVNEEFCHTFTTPSTLPDVGLLVERKTNETIKWLNSYIKEVINMDYLTPEGIKNFLLGIGEFKNWWEIKN